MADSLSRNISAVSMSLDYPSMMSAVNVSDANVCNDSRSGDQAMDIWQCLFWELFLWRGARVAIYFTFYFALLTLSVAMNCRLLYVTTVRGRYPRNPHYIILTNLAVCNILIAITPLVYMLPNTLQGRTATLNNWCISFVGILGSFLLACQMTLTLMVIDRYIFICDGIHYRRRVTPGRIRCALGAIWGLVGIININYGVLFRRKRRYDGKPIETLVCDPLEFEEYTELTSLDKLLLHGLNSVIIIASLVVIVTCYLLMFRAACKAALELRRSYRRALCMVCFYLIMIFMQMLPMFCALAMVSQGTVEQKHSHLVLVFLFTVPPLVSAALSLFCITDFRHSLLSLCRHREDRLEHMEMRVIRQRRGSRVVREDTECETGL